MVVLKLQISAPETYQMMKKSLAIATLAMSTISFASSMVFAETDKKQKAEADRSGWSASITDGLTPATMTEQQKTVVIQINEYLNKLTNLNGRFLQVNPDDGKQKGKFYIKRPGRIRFDYAPPSLQVIISDGDYLSIEDRDIDTVDRYPLENTPFRILLAKDVNILRDAIIKTVTETDEETSITMIDRKGKAIGQIELFFNKDPAFELREWKVTDSSGQITRVILSHLDYEKKIDGKLFELDVGENKIFNPF
ncbi:MAG: outer membrane lipoprotein carrier protein LolA [Rhizobiales bacterium]|nr:outer membrane lipoprotein carrier protein LolA [Hyphomicrobiales bacterium]